MSVETQKLHDCLNPRQVLWGQEMQPGVHSKMIRQSTRPVTRHIATGEAWDILVSDVFYSKADNPWRPSLWTQRDTICSQAERMTASRSDYKVRFPSSYFYYCYDQSNLRRKSSFCCLVWSDIVHLGKGSTGQLGCKVSGNVVPAVRK